MIGCQEVVTDEGQNGTFLMRIGSRAREGNGAAVPSRYHCKREWPKCPEHPEVGHLARGLKQVPMGVSPIFLR